MPLETHVDLVQVNDNTSSEAEVEAAVFRLHPYKAGGHTHLHAEHLKQWMWEAYPREDSKTPTRTKWWMCLVDILQHMWHTGDIPLELGLTILVLIP